MHSINCPLLDHQSGQISSKRALNYVQWIVAQCWHANQLSKDVSMVIYCDQRKVRRSSSAAVRQRFSVPLCSPGCSCPLAVCPLHFRRPESNKCSYSAESFETCVCVESERGRKVDSASNFIVIPASISHHMISKHVAMFLETELFIYLPHDLFIFLFVNLTDFLSFLQIFFSDWILLRSTKEIKGFFSKLVWNLIEQEWAEQRPSVLSCAAYLLCVLLHLMNIQSCTGSLSGFQSVSFFRFLSLATALFSHLHKDTRIQEKHT